ncbi:MAG TPA: HAMP domain-containing sensor histidine kinase [Acetobacteraceae bacterium]|nr:HAMP domain-containing sensor histidine kinase [Acetobacteraceae bacterium]
MFRAATAALEHLIERDRAGDDSTPESANRKWAGRLLIPFIYLGCFLAFAADMAEDNTVAFGVFYVPLVCTALIHRNRNSVWYLAAVACGMVIAGAFFPAVNVDLRDLIVNRILSVAAVLAAAGFVWHARDIQDQLSRQTRRAEAAEHIQREVFANLSNDIRTPLHAMLGLTQLMSTNCRPDQRILLDRVQRSGKQLLSTIENLIDLTQLDQRKLQNVAVDVGAVLRDAVEAARPGANERQIQLVYEPSSTQSCVAMADDWGVRRIMDNLISNAVRFSPPGSMVVVSTAKEATRVVAKVADAGVGIPAQVLHRLRERARTNNTDGSYWLEHAGTGLTLSQRLAEGMGASLDFRTELSPGTTATLGLRI